MVIVLIIRLINNMLWRYWNGFLSLNHLSGIVTETFFEDNEAASWKNANTLKYC